MNGIREVLKKTLFGGILCFVFAVFLILLFWSIGWIYFDGYRLELGGLIIPPPRYMAFLGLYGFFGLISGVSFAIGFVIVLSNVRGFRRFIEDLLVGEAREGFLVFSGSVLALMIPIGIRLNLLDGAVLTDDESSYRFMSELLATGRLYAESPPDSMFFDRVFMINDGHFYSQYFVGWPLLMIPGVLVGLSGYINALYSSLTVPALYFCAKRIVGLRWAPISILFFLISPMLQVSAATEMSHTSCIFLIAWATWAALRSQDKDSPVWTHGLLALCLSLAFFNRPTVAIGLGCPILVIWVNYLRKMKTRKVFFAIAEFLAMSLSFAALFFLVNYLQNGSVWQTSYSRVLEYYQETEYQIAAVTERNLQYLRNPLQSFALIGAAIFRLNYSMFGWPFSFVFVLFAVRKSYRLFMWSLVLCFFIVHFGVRTVGIDTFGPVHFLELGWPILLLSVSGIKGMYQLCLECDQVERKAESKALLIKYFPVALLISMTLLEILCFLPVRLSTLSNVAEAINMPRNEVERLGLRDAVVFAPQPFVNACASRPTRHFVFWRPNNDPDLTNSVLWVNHISIETDQRFMERFPNRTGYVMGWTRECHPLLIPVEELEPGQFPDAHWVSENSDANSTQTGD